MTATEQSVEQTAEQAVEQTVAALLRELDPGRDHGGGSYEHRAGAYWATWPGLDVRAMARLMRDREIRLITLTARPEPEHEDGTADGAGYRVIYHWDLGPTVLNLAVPVRSGTLPSIADLLPGADWAEREIRDYYDLAFSGREDTPTLMLRPGDPPGLFSRTADVATDMDPARVARAEQEG